MWNLVSLGGVFAIAVPIAAWPGPVSQAQAPASFTGTWALNKELSDQPPSTRESGEPRGQERHGGGYGRGGGMHGGFGGGGMGRGGYGGGGGRAAMDPEAAARMREAMRDIVDPPDRLTIVQTESMISITGPDGRTTRLSPDGKKIKDDNTGIERKTKWDAGKLVSEISGASQGKITQSFSLDPEHHQLKIVAVLQGRDNQQRTITHVYDPAPAQ
jgi:hypothetical protein